jgi:predicted dehydrogenase
MVDQESLHEPHSTGLPASRRDFIRAALAAAAPTVATPPARAQVTHAAPATESPRPSKRFKVGIVGLGHRGNHVAKFFLKHGGYEIHAAADYFQEAVDQFGDLHGVDGARRFVGLDGYKKLIDCGVDIVAIEHMPYFMPEHATAAIAAGKHVYMAKPVAVDVPGTLKIGELGKEATRKNLCFMVDYQAPTDPSNAEVRQRVLDGGLGKPAYVCTYGNAKRWREPTPETPKEEYLRNTLWLHHVELAADACVSYDIHAIDTAVWVLGKRPAVAMGFAETRRADAFLSGRDTVHCVMQFDDGLTWVHQHQSLKNQSELTGGASLCCKIYGTDACAVLPYGEKAFVRGGPKHFVGPVDNLYAEGVARNVAQFYTALTEGHFENPTVARSVDSHLAAILMREASYRRGRLTMEALLKENKRLVFDVTGLKA